MTSKTFILPLAMLLVLCLGSLGVVSGVGSYPAVDPNMVLYYHFNNDSSLGETDNLVVDVSSMGSNGTGSNLTFQSSTGVLGDGSIYFVGNHSYITNNANTTFNYSQPFTISFWIKSNNYNNSYISQRSYLGGRGAATNEGAFFQGKDNKTEFVIGNSTNGVSNPVKSKNNVFDNNWHNIVGVYNSSDIFLYQDGLLIERQVSNLVPTNPTKLFNIGRDGRSADYYFNGSFDEIIIYNKSLNNYEVANNYYTYNNTLNNINIDSCGSISGNFTIFNITTNLISNGQCLNLVGSVFSTIEGNNYNISFVNSGSSCSSSSNCYGINLGLFSNIGTLIKDVNIVGNYHSNSTFGIYIQSSYTTIANSSIEIESQDKAYGINIARASNLWILNNTINSRSIHLTHNINDAHGIIIQNSSIYVNNVYILNNRINTTGQTGESIQSSYGINLTLINNTLYSFESDSLRIDGFNITFFEHLIDSSNIVDGLPINYTYNLSNYEYDNVDFTGFGNVFCGYCSNINYTNCNFSGDGLILSNVTNINISNNRFNTTKGYGLYLNGNSFHNIFSNNNISTNGRNLWGIITSENEYNNFTDNNIWTYGYNSFGINPYKSKYSYFTDNNIWTYGSGSYGIVALTSSNNNSYLRNNVITSSSANFGMQLKYSGTSNYLENNSFDILYIYNSYNNTIKDSFHTAYIFNISSNSFYGLSDSLVYYSNFSSFILSGGVNITLTYQNYSYVLDNYNITEGYSRSYDPIWFSSSTATSKHIASNLSDTITTSITFNVDSCDNVGPIYYTPEGGSKQKFTKSHYTCENNQVTLASVNVAPATNSNEIEIQYGCSSTTKLGYSLVIILSALIIPMFCLFYIKQNGMSVGAIVIMFIGIMFGLVMWLAAGQNLGDCGVIS